MTSRFDDIYADVARPALREHLGQTITYVPAGDAESTELTAVIGSVQAEEREGVRGRTWWRTRSVTIARDPDAPGGGIAAPAANASFTIDGESWQIEGTEALSESQVTLRVVRPGAVERSRSGYRTKD